MTVRRSSFLVAAALSAAPLVAQEPAHSERVEGVQRAYLKGDYRRALQILSELLEQNPRDPDLLRRLAAIEAALGNLSEARTVIDRAKELAPKDSDILLARANILFWQGRYAEAESQAIELGQEASDYPGLAELQISLRNAQNATQLRLRSLGLGSSISKAEFASGPSQAWAIQRASTLVGWGKGSLATLQLEREQRLETDTRISGSMDLPIGRHRLSVSGSVTPSPNFRERWSVGAGGEIDTGKSTRLLIDGRYATYSEGNVTAFGFGARQKFTESLSITARTIHIFGGGEAYRLGGALRVDYDPDDDFDLFVTVARYPDVESDGTRILRSAAGGVAVRIGERLTLGLISEYDVREESYKRSAISVDLRWDLGVAQ